MRRYWFDPEFLNDTEVEIAGDSYHHICKVCRQKLGDKFEVIISGTAYFVEIVEMNSKVARANILEKRQIPKLPKPNIHLALSLPKFQTVDKVVEKMVELGVSNIHLFSSDNSFMKPKQGEFDKKLQRWQKIIQGATQQTGRGELMELTGIQPLRVLLEETFSSSKNWGLLAYEGEGGQSLGAAIQEGIPEAENIWIFVGAEGGFSPEDLKLFKNYKLLPVSLGDQVLRVETACVTLVSILKYALKQYD